ncbi:MAG: zinc ABC transporter substrate-binding protein [Halioglobus sp.]
MPYIVAVNNPLLYFTRRLIGNEFEIRLLAPADADPASWRPTVEDVLQLQGADLVLLNGAGYSYWLDEVSISSSKLVVTGEAAKKHWIPQEEQVTHSHGPGGEHAHGNYAFTTWMDLSLARLQAGSIAAALQQRWPAHKESVNKNLQQLDSELDALDRAYREQAKQLAGRDIIYSHPVYQYFKHRYRLPGQSLHWEPNAMPSDEQWQKLSRSIGESSLFIWEGEPNPVIATRMAALGLAFVVVDPAANRSEKDWLSVQRENLERLSIVVTEVLD